MRRVSRGGVERETGPTATQNALQRCPRGPDMTVRRLAGCDVRKVVDGVADRQRPSLLWLGKLVSKAEFSIDPNHEQSMPKLWNAVVGSP